MLIAVAPVSLGEALCVFSSPAFSLFAPFLAACFGFEAFLDFFFDTRRVPDLLELFPLNDVFDNSRARSRN